MRANGHQPNRREGTRRDGAGPDELPVHCGRAMTPILYGLPSAEMIKARERGEVELGGCCIHPGIPRFVCRACGHEIGDLDDRSNDPEHGAGRWA